MSCTIWKYWTLAVQFGVVLFNPSYHGNADTRKNHYRYFIDMKYNIKIKIDCLNNKVASSITLFTAG